MTDRGRRGRAARHRTCPGTAPNMRRSARWTRDSRIARDCRSRHPSDRTLRAGRRPRTRRCPRSGSRPPGAAPAPGHPWPKTLYGSEQWPGRSIVRSTGRTDGPILRSTLGTRMDRHAATRRLKHLAATAGVRMPRIHPHMLLANLRRTLSGPWPSMAATWSDSPAGKRWLPRTARVADA